MIKMSEYYDIIIKNGLMVDGTGNPRYKGSLAIRDETIVSISGEKISGSADKIIEAEGLVVSPGFIDVHNHGDLSILYYPDAPGFIRQGITTFVGGQCGDSPGPFGEYIGLPWVLSDLYEEIDPRMYVKEWLQPRDKVNERHREVYGWDIDWNTMGDFFHRVKDNGLAPNYVPMVGHGDIRSLVMGLDYKREATDSEIKEMVQHTRRAMEEGCRGITTGRDYDPGIWATFDEVLECAKAAARYEGIYQSHCLRTGHRKPRRPGEWPPKKTEGVLEAIEIGRKAEVPVQISHLGVLFDIRPSAKHVTKAAIESTLSIIDDAIEEGIEVDFDIIPHHLTGGISTTPWLIHTLQPWLRIAGSAEQLGRALRMKEFRREIKEALYKGKHYYFNPNINPDWAKQRIIAVCDNQDYLEKSISEIAEELNKNEFETLFRILIEDPHTKAVRKGDDDWVKLEFYKHPNMMIGVDTFAVDDKRESRFNPPSYPNQNSYGGFPHYLSRAVRETSTLTLEEAIRKVTCEPARKFRVEKRGILQEGAYADITIFDIKTINDMGTQLEPRKYPEGIEYVIVNGETVFDGKVNGSRPGKILSRK
jgi:N-acyl-D-aspartate/D-glutamate deacylase